MQRIFSLIRHILQAQQNDLKLRSGHILGRAWAPLHPAARLTQVLFRDRNYNNILLHARNINQKESVFCETTGTFNSSRYFEKRVLQISSELLKLPFSRFSGYITTGGTEANIYALWIARNWSLSFESKQSHWIIPENAHYSCAKALDLLGISISKKHKIHIIPSDSHGTLDFSYLSHIYSQIRNQDLTSPIIIFSTAMTTELGVIDPLHNIHSLISGDAFVFFHVDASFSGFVLPFLDIYQDIFQLPSLRSISLDYHKTLGGPVGSGAIIFAQDFEKYAEIPASYLRDASDYTLVGSRKGSDALAIFSILSVETSSSLQKKNLRARLKARWLSENMSQISEISIVYQPISGYVMIQIPETSREQFEPIFSQFSISSSVSKVAGQSQRFYKIIVRHDTSWRTLKRFVKSLQ